MAIRRVSDSGLTGKRYNDASAGATKIPDVPGKAQAPIATDAGSGRAFNNGAASVSVSSGARGGIASTYTVTSNPGSYTATGSSPVTVTGLQSGTSYTFTAVAANSTGTASEASNASNSITATTVPGVISGTPVATKVNGTTVSLAFTEPNNGGSIITGYTVTSSPSIALSTSGLSSPVTVTGTFVANTSYTFTIVATNANGTQTTQSSASNGIAPLSSYQLSQTFTSSGTYTVPSGITSLAVYAVGGGGRGAQYGGGGGGGAAFQDYSVSAGQTFAVGVGGSEGQSYFGSLAYANAGNNGNVRTGGNGSSNVSGAVFATGGTGGVTSSTAASNGGNLTLNALGLTTVQVGGGGGAGGAGAYWQGARDNQGYMYFVAQNYGGSGAGGGTVGGGSGGNGGNVNGASAGNVGSSSSGWNNGNAGNSGSANTGGGGGGGGGGASGYNSFYEWGAGTSGGSDGNGGSGKVIVYARA